MKSRIFQRSCWFTKYILGAPIYELLLTIFHKLKYMDKKGYSLIATDYCLHPNFIPDNIWPTESRINPNMMKNDIQECFGIITWWFGLLGFNTLQQPRSYQCCEMMMMMKSVFFWRKLDHPEETTDLRQVNE